MIRALALSLALVASQASADMIRVESAHDVDTTIDRLAAAVEGAGAKVFARIEHAECRQSGNAEVRSAQRAAGILCTGMSHLEEPFEHLHIWRPAEDRPVAMLARKPQRTGAEA